MKVLLIWNRSEFDSVNPYFYRHLIIPELLESKYGHTVVHAEILTPKLLFNGGFDVVVGTDPLTFLYAWLIGRRSGAKVVFDFRDAYLSFYERTWPTKVVLRALLSRPDDILTANRVFVDEYDLDERRTVHAPNGAPKAWTHRDRTPIEGRFCYAGQLSRSYNLDVAIRALGRIADEYPQAHLVIAGEGDERENLERLASEMSIMDRVDFVGFIPHEELPELLLSSEVGIALNPWVGNKEAEYLACGCPCLSNEERAAREGVPGIHTVPLDAEGVANGMRTLLDDDAYATELGERGRQQVREFYNWDTQVDIWNDTLSGGRSRDRDREGVPGDDSSATFR